MAIFAPNDPTPVYAPTHNVTRMGDQSAPIGNDSARLRRKGTPRTTRDWQALMAAPKGR